jgi:hypothetical protein
MDDRRSTISPRGAVALGLVVIACGVASILGALDTIPYRLTPGTPVWVGIAAGSAFVFGGLALINGYALGGGPDFDRAAGRLVYIAQQMLGFGICAAFAAIAGWIAFGPGERRFGQSIALPFWHSAQEGNASVGRVAFGFGAVMSAGIALVALVRAVRGRKRSG